MDRQRLREVSGERVFASQTSRDGISIACMADPKFSAVLIFFLVNYFLTFLIIGLLAGVLSLINKPKPLRVDVVAEALFAYYLLFTIGINNLVNFVAHVFFGDFSAVYRMAAKPISSRSRIRQPRCGNCRSHCVQGEPAISSCDANSAIGVRVGSSRRAHLPDDRGEEFLARQCGSGSPKRYPYPGCWFRVVVALVQTSATRPLLVG